MDDGGTVVITSPVNPARCPPAPYERASLIAHYLKTKKPRSKVIVLDAKESFTMQKLFEAAWKELYPGMIEWVGLSNGGALSSVDAGDENARHRLRQVPGRRRQRDPAAEGRARVAELAGVADRTGWCPVDPVTFRVQAADEHPRHRRRSHRGRDAALGFGGAFAGGDLRRRDRRAAGRQDARAAPTLISSCYSLIAPDYAISQRGHLPAGGRPVCRGRRRRGHQPARRAARRARAEAEQAERLVPRRSPARCSDDGPCAAPVARRSRSARRRRGAGGAACLTRSSAMPFRSR